MSYSVIFLDIDGVLNSNVEDVQSEVNVYNSDGWHVSIPRVQCMNALVRGLEYRIVLSSAWRLKYSLNDVENQLRKAGATWSLHHQTINFFSTPLKNAGVKELRYNPHDWGYPHPKMSEYSFPTRALEIHQWLVRHQSNVKSYVVLDDDYSWGFMTPRVVKTNPYFGLTERDVEDAKVILDKPVNNWEFQPVHLGNLWKPWTDWNLRDEDSF
jgi:hypothetical protein